MKTIGFIGLGLIGGSIARTIRKFHPDYRLLAFDKDRSALAEAVSLNVINGICDIDDEQLYNCDYLFLCAPVEFNVEYMEKIKDSLGKNCILTDVGSVKSVIHEKVTELGLEGRSERSGFSNSSDHLLENAYYIITPGGEVALEKISDFTELISSLGAIPLVITAEEHDFITAGVSHLPHIVASALVNLVNLLDNDAQYMKMIAAGGFRDITRIASSSPVMWEQICLENQKNISTVLDEFIRMLIQIRCSIDNKEADNIFDMFASSKDYRDSIDIVDNSLIPRSYVLYIDVAATEKVSIKNIGIIHNREFEDGVLKIEFYTDAALEQAKVLLTKRNYKICER